MITKPKTPIDEKYFESARTRLMKSIEKNENGCWIWKRANNQKYGVMYFKRKQTYSHRVSYEIFKKKCPGKFYVCHHCDTPLCCNPDHLFLATNKENMEDARKKGRMMCGERQPIGKLTKEKVIEIRKLLAKGISQSKIAKQFGIAQTGVSGINIRRYWKHI
jgi:hypothetical protein